jgi:hypothetical protein
MNHKVLVLLASLGTAIWLEPTLAQDADGAERPPNVELRNGLWFDGTGFEPKTMYSVGGVFATRRPERVDQALDLGGAFVVPPFAEAHNHNIGTGLDEFERRAIANYLAAGVFYVKIQGNLPLDAEGQRRLGLNRPDGLDVSFAQGSLTGVGGHPAALDEIMLGRGFFPGHTSESLRDHRYFEIDSSADLDRKWPAIAALQPDFIKVFQMFSEEFERRRDDPASYGRRGLDPRLLPAVVAKAHGAGLLVTSHVTTVADFRNAVGAGVDEIAHVPLIGVLTDGDAKLAAQRGITVVTTMRVASTLIGTPAGAGPPPATMEGLIGNVGTLLRNSVRVVIGSDDGLDQSTAAVIHEATMLLESALLDELGLLRLWTGVTAEAIFRGRRIGALEEGYEASFVALEGNPLEDWANVRRIRMRFKQGIVLIN